MPKKKEEPPVRPPESNAEEVIDRLVYQTDDLDGSGVVKVLKLLLTRAEQLRKLNRKLANADQRVVKKEITTQEEYNAEILDGLYETTCLKWFLATALSELAWRLESEVYGAQLRCNPIKEIVYNAEGEVESFLLERDK
jgi:hypothetical protein